MMQSVRGCMVSEWFGVELGGRDSGDGELVRGLFFGGLLCWLGLRCVGLCWLGIGGIWKCRCGLGLGVGEG